MTTNRYEQAIAGLEIARAAVCGFWATFPGRADTMGVRWSDP